jgi:hypothetical protein
MSASSRILLIISGLAGLGLICLITPLILLAIAVRPPVYPGAVYIGSRAPSVNASLKTECAEIYLTSRWNYHAPDEPLDILHWFQAEGWLTNYRYSTATLLQSSDAFNIIRSTFFRDMYTDKAGSTTMIVSTTYYTLALGKCIPNPSGLPIP